MSGVRYRLLPTDDQAETLIGHCAAARFVWNLALEQWRGAPQGRRARSERQRRGQMPGVAARGQQLTEIRALYPWLAAEVAEIQQQALRDFHQAVTNFYQGTHRPPKWRKKDEHEGFRVVNADRQPAQRVNRQFGQVFVPKVGWVRFRLTRPVPQGVNCSG